MAPILRTASGPPSPVTCWAGALDVKDFAERLPARLNKVLAALAEGNFTLNVEGVDEGVDEAERCGASRSWPTGVRRAE